MFVIHCPFLFFKPSTWLFLIWLVAYAWKKAVFLSPSISPNCLLCYFHFNSCLWMAVSSAYNLSFLAFDWEVISHLRIWSILFSNSLIRCLAIPNFWLLHVSKAQAQAFNYSPTNATPKEGFQEFLIMSSHFEWSTHLASNLNFLRWLGLPFFLIVAFHIKKGKWFE